MTITHDIEKQYWSIGEVSDMLLLPESCIRFWCQEFEIEAKRSKANHRLFMLHEITKLHVIKFLLHVEKYSVDGCKSKLKLLRWPMTATRWEKEVRSQLSRIVSPESKAN